MSLQHFNRYELYVEESKLTYAENETFYYFTLLQSMWAEEKNSCRLSFHKNFNWSENTF